MMDRFLLATNPFRPGLSALCIVHLLDPVTVILCSLDQLDPEMGVFRRYEYWRPGSLPQKWILSIRSFLPKNADASLRRQYKVLDRSWYWFRSYIESQNKIQ